MRAWVGERKREREQERERESVCVCMREREGGGGECASVCENSPLGDEKVFCIERDDSDGQRGSG